MTRRHLHVTGDCRAVGAVLARIGDKWSVLVVSRLGGGPIRFNELKREIGGISQRMLTLTLRGLERDGLVTRTIYPTVPPRVEYALTPLGRSLLEPVSRLGQWALAHRRQIADAQKRYDTGKTEKPTPIYARRATSAPLPSSSRRAGPD
jgi:DNA-binding HxlR family transcriptional regulator